MTYTVKSTYEHATDDVMLHIIYLVPEVLSGAFKDSRVTGSVLLRSEDKTYAEIYHSWDSKQDYLSWVADKITEEFQEEDKKFAELLSNLGIVHNHYEPDAEDYDWTEHPSRRADKVSYPESAIDTDDIYPVR